MITTGDNAPLITWSGSDRLGMKVNSFSNQHVSRSGGNSSLPSLITQVVKRFGT